MVQRRFAPARMGAILLQDRRNDLAQVYYLTGGHQVFVNPYTGAILGTRDRDPALISVLITIHQLHLRLGHIRIGKTDVGKGLVEFGGIETLVLLPTGFWFWGKKKKLTINLKASGKRINGDVHNGVGLFCRG